MTSKTTITVSKELHRKLGMMKYKKGYSSFEELFREELIEDDND